MSSWSSARPLLGLLSKAEAFSTECATRGDIEKFIISDDKVQYKRIGKSQTSAICYDPRQQSSQASS
ncbi:MAG: hypothetical protein JW896_17190 [Deltaproteobacteria bacterium]|nr:hypothetical protein [Deltaproteobacteria bacterium]